MLANLNPATDIYFSQGPMDVLDHSCSKLGFGGKMCIDGTRKWEEEQHENYTSGAAIASLPLTSILKQFPEIKAINDSLLLSGIPCIVVAVKKNRKKHVVDLHNALCSSVPDMESIKLVLYVEHTVNPHDLTTALWRFCNNLDPKRDHILFQRPLRVYGFRWNEENGSTG